MESNQKKLSWFALFKWAFNDTINKTYTSEEKSRFYDRIAKDFFHRYRLAEYIVERIIVHFPAQQPYICERAAGSGIITETLHKKGLTRIRASDLSESQLLILKEKLEGLEIAIENFNEPMEGIEDNLFDVVFQVGATRFMSKDGQINYIQEAARTLKQDGILIWPVMWAEVPLTWLRTGLSSPRTLSFRITRLLEKEGFEIVEAPWVIHGRMGLLTSTVLVAKKTGNSIQRGFMGTFVHLFKKRAWKFLGKAYEI